MTWIVEEYSEKDIKGKHTHTTHMQKLTETLVNTLSHLSQLRQSLW